MMSSRTSNRLAASMARISVNRVTKTSRSTRAGRRCRSAGRAAARPYRASLHCIDERCQTLNSHFEPVAGFNGPDAAWRPGEDDIAGHQGHVGRNETHQVIAVKDQLAGV